MSQPRQLFDIKEGERLRREGMQKAANKRQTDLAIARDIAKLYAKKRGYCHADMVGQALYARGINLGNAAGSVFRGKEWEPTGEYIKSSRKARHAGLLRVWRLK